MATKGTIEVIGTTSAGNWVVKPIGPATVQMLQMSKGRWLDIKFQPQPKAPKLKLRT